eukprot:6469749-Amphidinium_carterae.2
MEATCRERAPNSRPNVLRAGGFRRDGGDRAYHVSERKHHPEADKGLSKVRRLLATRNPPPHQPKHHRARVKSTA